MIHLKFAEQTDARLDHGHLVGHPQAQITAAEHSLERHQASTISPLFEPSRRQLLRERNRLQAKSGHRLADLSLFYVTKTTSAQAERLVAELSHNDAIETVYAVPAPPPPPAVTPDFTSSQGYLLAAPDGLGSSSAWLVPGGDGSETTITDIEYGWNRDHEDLTKLAEPEALIPNGTPIDPWDEPNHGTAVMGILGADRNAFGVTGTLPNASLRLVNAYNSERGWDIANALNTAREVLDPGDIILIEQQVSGPSGAYIPVEWMFAVYEAIRWATAEGIIVVEAAGNGSADLDDPGYGSPFPGGSPDSGAIIAGAGYTACAGAPRSRAYFSTYGSRVNLQGWGTCVTTTGYGYLYGTGNTAYTSNFNGTSSASPMVAAAAASLSSAIQRLEGRAPTPLEVRERLEATSTPQDTTTAGTVQGHIGGLPNVPAALLGLTDTVAPTPPRLQAELFDTGLVRLTWERSTDNLAVTGYEVRRDGKPLATLGEALTYDDDARPQPGTTYTYMVVAHDAAGNQSAPSVPALISVPAITVSPPVLEPTLLPPTDSPLSDLRGIHIVPLPTVVRVTRLVQRRRTLVLRGTRTLGASGPLIVTVSLTGRGPARLRRTLAVRSGRFTANLRLPAGVHARTLTVSYRGDSKYAPRVVSQQVGRGSRTHT